jgi:hypothetical protein
MLYRRGMGPPARLLVASRQGLGANSTLTSLDISSNSLGGDGTVRAEPTADRQCVSAAAVNCHSRTHGSDAAHTPCRRCSARHACALRCARACMVVAAPRLVSVACFPSHVVCLSHRVVTSCLLHVASCPPHAFRDTSSAARLPGGLAQAVLCAALLRASVESLCLARNAIGSCGRPPPPAAARSEHPSEGSRVLCQPSGPRGVCLRLCTAAPRPAPCGRSDGPIAGSANPQILHSRAACRRPACAQP